MSTDTITSQRRPGAWRHRVRRTATRWGALASAGLALAACGAPVQAGVAHLGGTPTPTASAGSLSKAQGGLAFSRCMRQHGISNFPDPGSGGGIEIHPGMGFDPESSRFQSAQQACRALMPHGSEPNPAEAAAMQQAALRFSQCMRQHGIADFPDPQFGQGSMSLMLPHSIDPHAPQFQAAQSACQSLMPKPPGGGSTTRGPEGGGPGPVTQDGGPGPGTNQDGGVAGGGQ